jgi:transcriptional regulator with XRE-family HTH domain
MSGADRRLNPVFSAQYAAIREAPIAARQEQQLSQRILAARLGRSHSHVARIECGQRRIDVLELYLIARCLGVEPTLLFDALARRLDGMEQRS